MEQYISKTALVAEIEKQMELAKFKAQQAQEKNDYVSSFGWSEHFATCGDILKTINTLEVKEVDLDALGILAEHLIACDAHGITPKYSDRELDFLEGLANNKAQKGEQL